MLLNGPASVSRLDSRAPAQEGTQAGIEGSKAKSPCRGGRARDGHGVGGWGVGGQVQGSHWREGGQRAWVRLGVGSGVSVRLVWWQELGTLPPEAQVW